MFRQSILHLLVVSCFYSLLPFPCLPASMSILKGWALLPEDLKKPSLLTPSMNKRTPKLVLYYFTSTTNSPTPFSQQLATPFPQPTSLLFSLNEIVGGQPPVTLRPWMLFFITALITISFTYLATITGHTFSLKDLPLFSILTGSNLDSHLNQPVKPPTLSWSYIHGITGSGSSSWGHLLDPTGTPLYPHCSATQQSPIDIIHKGSELPPTTSSPLALHFYDPSMPLASMHVLNSGVQFFPLPTTNATWVPPLLVHHHHHHHHSITTTPGHSSSSSSSTGLPPATSHASTTTLYLRQFHFHTPSEHTIDGQRFPLEVHFVYFREGSPSPSAVLGVLFPAAPPGDPGHPALKSIWDHLHPHPSLGSDRRSEHFHVEGRLNMHDLLRATEAVYYTYPGSLTTPPCTEGVQWYVLRSTVGVSEEQSRESLGGVENFRETMPLNGRTVLAFSQQ